MTDITIKKRAPLEMAALDFAALLQQIEELEDIDQAVLSTFGEMKLELADAVDRRIYFLQFLESQVEHVDKMVKAWQSRKKVLQNLTERMEESTKHTILSANGKLKLSGTTGELSVQRSPPKLDLLFEPMRKSFDVLTHDVASKYEIPSKYIQHTEFLQLNKDALREDLQAGIELSWAKIVRGNHIRIKI